MSVKASVSISDQQDAFARDLVAEGRYASLSAVIQRGLDLVRAEAEREAAEIAALRGFFAARAGEAHEDAAAARARTAQTLKARRAARGL